MTDQTASTALDAAASWLHIRSAMIHADMLAVGHTADKDEEALRFEVQSFLNVFMVDCEGAGAVDVRTTRDFFAEPEVMEENVYQIVKRRSKLLGGRFERLHKKLSRDKSRKVSTEYEQFTKQRRAGSDSADEARKENDREEDEAAAKDEKKAAAKSDYYKSYYIPHEGGKSGGRSGKVDDVEEMRARAERRVREGLVAMSVLEQAEVKVRSTHMPEAYRKPKHRVLVPTKTAMAATRSPAANNKGKAKEKAVGWAHDTVFLDAETKELRGDKKGPWLTILDGYHHYVKQPKKHYGRTNTTFKEVGADGTFSSPGGLPLDDECSPPSSPVYAEGASVSLPENVPVFSNGIISFLPWTHESSSSSSSPESSTPPGTPPPSSSPPSSPSPMPQQPQSIFRLIVPATPSAVDWIAAVPNLEAAVRAHVFGCWPGFAALHNVRTQNAMAGIRCLTAADRREQRREDAAYFGFLAALELCWVLWRLRSASRVFVKVARLASTREFPGVHEALDERVDAVVEYCRRLKRAERRGARAASEGQDPAAVAAVVAASGPRKSLFVDLEAYRHAMSRLERRLAGVRTSLTVMLSWLSLARQCVAMLQVGPIPPPRMAGDESSSGQQQPPSSSDCPPDHPVNASSLMDYFSYFCSRAVPSRLSASDAANNTVVNRNNDDGEDDNGDDNGDLDGSNPTQGLLDSSLSPAWFEALLEAIAGIGCRVKTFRCIVDGDGFEARLASTGSPRRFAASFSLYTHLAQAESWERAAVAARKRVREAGNRYDEYADMCMHLEAARCRAAGREQGGGEDGEETEEMEDQYRAAMMDEDEDEDEDTKAEDKYWLL